MARQSRINRWREIAAAGFRPGVPWSMPFAAVRCVAAARIVVAVVVVVVMMVAVMMMMVVVFVMARAFHLSLELREVTFKPGVIGAGSVRIALGSLRFECVDLAPIIIEILG
jgi:hypothetical protein